MDPYATHLPLLRTLGKKVYQVLEFGSGLYSTPLFLNRNYYPNLMLLDSLEHNRQWADKVAAACSKDSRLLLLCVPEPLEKAVGNDLRQYDLILIDNGDTWTTRQQTIRHVAQAKLKDGAKIVIHDFEFPEYAKIATEVFSNIQVSTELTPHTAVCWR